MWSSPCQWIDTEVVEYSGLAPLMCFSRQYFHAGQRIRIVRGWRIPEETVGLPGEVPSCSSQPPLAGKSHQVISTKKETYVMANPQNLRSIYFSHKDFSWTDSAISQMCVYEKQPNPQTQQGPTQRASIERSHDRLVRQWSLHGGGKEPAPTSCPLAFTSLS